jgi:hypothetical protein
MFRQPSDIESKLDAEINAALVKLDELPDKTSEDYGLLVDRISKLYKLKAEERPERISPNGALVVAANVIGIVWITQHERLHPITTKALGFIMKPRS